MQNWTRLYDYINEYQHLVYDYYSKHAVAFLTTYYNINKDVTVWDDEDLLGGSYERVGELTGIKYDKYMLLPVYFPDEVSTARDGQDIGLIKENTSSITIPSSYGMTPLEGDLLKFDQSFLRPTNNVYPVFVVSGIEIHPNTDYRFWKLKIEIFQSKTLDDVEQQLNNTYVFFDYDKTIHTLADAELLADILYQNEELQNRIALHYDPNSGFITT